MQDRECVVNWFSASLRAQKIESCKDALYTVKSFLKNLILVKEQEIGNLRPYFCVDLNLRL